MRLHTTLQGKIDEAMTELTPAAVAVLDPAFANGMGSLQEDADKGLRCPHQGCGQYKHFLGRHWDRSHAGGAPKLRELLSLPATAPLVSRSLVERQRAHDRPGRKIVATPAQCARAGTRRRETEATIGARNLKSRCHAQLAQRLGELVTIVGRTPTFREATVAWGGSEMAAIIRIYGSWNAFKRQVGVEVLHRGGQAKLSPDDALDQLKSWLLTHNELPAYDEANDSPAISKPRTIMRAFSTQEWPIAMKRAALILNLRSSRYYPKQRRRMLLRRCHACAQLTKTDSACEWCGAPIASVA